MLKLWIKIFLLQEISRKVLAAIFDLATELKQYKICCAKIIIMASNFTAVIGRQLLVHIFKLKLEL